MVFIDDDTDDFHFRVYDIQSLRERLIDVLELLRYPSFEIRARAVERLNEILDESGLSFSDVFLPQLNHVEAARQCLSTNAQFNDWQRRFLNGIQERDELSLKQHRRLAAICSHVGVPWPQ